MTYEPSPEAIAGRQIFGRALRATRESKGLTQERLALEAGFDRSFLVEVESGKHSLMLDRVFDLARALEVEAAEFLRPL